jgi:hypothetical protein
MNYSIFKGANESWLLQNEKAIYKIQLIISFLITYVRTNCWPQLGYLDYKKKTPLALSSLAYVIVNMLALKWFLSYRKTH